MPIDPRPGAARDKESGSGAPPDQLPLVVGIGGSSGALAALMPLLEGVSADRIAIVVALRLDPGRESDAVEILQRSTPFTVLQVDEKTALEAGRVYVVAPGTNLVFNDQYVKPTAADAHKPSAAIDLFFRSLAETHRERAIGILLSGTGRDGSLGLGHIKELGGLTIVQSPADSEHSDMPRAAIGTGAVDLVLTAVEIGNRLDDVARIFFQTGSTALSGDGDALRAGESSGDDESEQRAFFDVLTALRIRTRHDFRHYKRGTVMRRLQRRMQVNGVDSIQAYRDFVRRNPEELASLLADMLISVTNFFRDPDAFDSLKHDVIPQLMEGVPEGEEVRVWIPGCASGEESYSVAILLQEYADSMRNPPRVQVFASDINDAALNFARAGVYPSNIVADITDTRLLGYFEKEQGDHFRVRSAIREMIVFARHNVLTDPPFSRLDLICCRNLLIYLDRTAQSIALEMFAFALKPGGYLFLGNAESIDSAAQAFHTVSKEHRIYRLRPDASSVMRSRIPSQLIGSAGMPMPAQIPTINRGFEPMSVQQSLAMLHDRALVNASPPSVLINADYEIERVSPGAGRFVTFGEGLPTRSLLSNVAADIRVELRAALYRAAESSRPVRSVFLRAGEREDVRGSVLVLSVYPVPGEEESAAYWLVIFDEPAESLMPVPPVEEAGNETYQLAMRRMEEENRSLKAHLQDTLDRSAISNEELKASNEELQAINEELRSAKEELETSKEELQSVNEELTTVNYELRLKVDEAGRNNDDLRNLIEASEIATVFVDQAMRVKRFTPQASKLFALIPSDIGRPLLDVKSRLKYDEMVEDASAVFNQLRPVERAVSSIDDEHFFARILPYRTSQDKIGGAVLTFVNVTELRRAESRVKAAEDRLRDAIASNKDFAVISTDINGKVTSWNEGAKRMYGYDSDEIVGKPIDLIYTAIDRAAGVPEQERRLAAQLGRASDERWHLRSDQTTIYCSGVVTPLHGNSRMGFVKIALDISERKLAELKLGNDLYGEQLANARLKATSELKDRFLAVVSHELKQPLNLIQMHAELLLRLPETAHIPQAQRIGQSIRRAVAGQSKIVNDLLDLSRAQTGKLRLEYERTDLSALVERLVLATSPETGQKNIQVRSSIAPDLVCSCDPVRIEQVVWNLLGNAIKFTPAGGRIEVGLDEQDGYARLEVSDTGMGIAPEAMGTIFDLFSQAVPATAPGRGTGLGIGLALVRDLVEAHGGRVQAVSDGRDKGASFTVWLPLRAAETPPHAELPRQSMFAGLRVLAVDDDEESVTALAAILSLEGAIVKTAFDAAEALQLLQAEPFDLLLSDIGMPQISGIELIRRARKLNLPRRLRAIATTGYGGNADIRRALEAGFDAHLTKPVSLEGLFAAVEAL